MPDHAFTAADMAEAAHREVRQRQRVYPRFIESEKMTATFAARQIALMEAIAAHFDKLAQGDRLL